MDVNHKALNESKSAATLESLIEFHCDSIAVIRT